MNPLGGLASNPLAMVGLQLLANNQRQPGYVNPLQGVPQALMGAAYQQRVGKQNALEDERMARMRTEWEHQDAERQRREAVMRQLQSLSGQGQQMAQAGAGAMVDEPADLQAGGYPINPLNPQSFIGAMMQGDQAMQSSAQAALMGMLKPAGSQNLMTVGKTVFDPVTRQPIFTAPDDPNDMTFDQRMALAKARGGQGTRPSDIQVYEYFKGLDDNGKRDMLLTMRGQSPINLGGQFVQPDPVNPGAALGAFPVTPKPGDMPEFRGQQATAVAAGKERGAAVANLEDRVASQPRLEDVVAELSALGKKATYTKAGQLVDAGKRQLGMKVGEGAVARTEYMAKVDNEVLPLLRQTFGAAFTQKEGESLRVTLGDPDKSPEEKDAVLRAFIESKRAQIAVGKQRLGNPALPSYGAEIAPNQGGPKFLGFE